MSTADPKMSIVDTQSAKLVLTGQFEGTLSQNIDFPAETEFTILFYYIMSALLYRKKNQNLSQEQIAA